MRPEDRNPKHADRRFAFQCHRTWRSLTRTSDPNVRHCDECRRDVHLCVTEEEAVMRAHDHECVAISARPRTRTGPLPILLPRVPGSKTLAIGMFDSSLQTVFWLLPLDGPQAGHTLKLPRAPFTLGRGPADVVLLDQTLAPVHLRFEHDGDELYAYDARHPPGSPERTASALGLYDGLIFTIGQTQIVFKSTEFRSEDRRR